MNSYQVKANRKPAIIWMFSLFVIGFLLISAHIFGLKNYLGVVQCLGFVLIVASLLLCNRWILTNYLYEIEKDPNALAELPKLNIYASRGHNFGHHFFCVPLVDAYEVIPWSSRKKADFPCNNCLGSMYAKRCYLVIFSCEGDRRGVMIECDEAFYQELDRQIKLYSTVRSEEETQHD